MGGRHGGRGRQAPRRGYYWDGLQWPSTAIVTAGTAFELVGPTAQEFMPGTITRIRGFITMMQSSTTGGQLAHKIMYLEVNDAGAITGDHQAIDTDEEDIAMRQLWTHQMSSRAVATSDGQENLNVEVDVRVKVKLQASGKWILALIADATTASTYITSGYLRALIQHA